MDPETQRYADSQGTVHAALRKLLDGLPEKALRTPLRSEKHSLPIEQAHMSGYVAFAGLTAHMCGSESMFVHDALTGKNVARDKHADYQTGASVAELLALIDRVDAETRRILQAATPEELRESVEVGKRFHDTKRGPILPAIEHLHYHLGCMYLMRQLWDSQERLEGDSPSATVEDNSKGQRRYADARRTG